MSNVFSEKMFVEEKKSGSDNFQVVGFTDGNRTQLVKLFPVSNSVFESLELGKTYEIEIKEVSS